MEISKKPKRPRIGESQDASADNGHFEKVTYNPNPNAASERPQFSTGEQASTAERVDYQQQGYGQSNYSGNNRNYSQNNYNNRNNNYSRNNNRQGGYNQGGYGNSNRQQQGGYNNYNNRLQGGYNNNYNNRQQQGGYNNYNNQGGYGNSNRQQQGGYNNYNNQGGYNNNNNRQQQGGYNNNNRQQQGGYNNRQQGGYNNRQQQGGYNNRQQGGGFNNNNNRRNNNFNNRPQPGQGKRFTPRPKPIVYEMPEFDPNEEIRLNKFMANAGVCSRREADELIQQGKVLVNGTPVTELGTKIKHTDVVEYNEKVVTLENKCYILLNKPKDCVTTSDDPDGRLTVMDLVKNACKERIYPVGRLDRNTTGVLLLTNDGDLASKLTHPKYVKKKIYQVWTDKDISEDDMQRLADGIELEDGPIHADAISYVNDRDKNQAGIEIHSGRNRIVRRMFESLGYRVTKLDRVYFAGLTKKNLPRGRWRYLTQEEVNYLKQGSFE